MPRRSLLWARRSLGVLCGSGRRAQSGGFLETAAALEQYFRQPCYSNVPTTIAGGRVVTPNRGSMAVQLASSTSDAAASRKTPVPGQRRHRIAPLRADQPGGTAVGRVFLRGPFPPARSKQGQGPGADGRTVPSRRRADHLQRGRRSGNRPSIARPALASVH